LSAGLLLDTNVLGEFGREDANPAIRFWLGKQNAATLFVPSIAIGELAYGVAKLPVGSRRLRFEAWYTSLQAQFATAIVPFDTHAAVVWGRLRADLGASGQERPTIDLQIAAIALCRNLAVVTGNERHFAGLGVEVINPLNA
jgi:predicted nucleic acid-binding protein